MAKKTTKKGASKKTASKKTVSKKTASKKAASKKVASKKVASKKAASKTSVSKKSVSKKTAAKKTESQKTESKADAATPAKKPASGKGATVRVTLVRSIAGKLKKHRATVRGLGLRRIRHTVELEDTPAVRGMIRKVSYLIRVEEA